MYIFFHPRAKECEGPSYPPPPISFSRTENLYFYYFLNNRPPRSEINGNAWRLLRPSHTHTHTRAHRHEPPYIHAYILRACEYRCCCCGSLRPPRREPLIKIMFFFRSQTTGLEETHIIIRALWDRLYYYASVLRKRADTSYCTHYTYTGMYVYNIYSRVVSELYLCAFINVQQYNNSL